MPLQNTTLTGSMYVKHSTTVTLPQKLTGGLETKCISVSLPLRKENLVEDRLYERNCNVSLLMLIFEEFGNSCNFLLSSTIYEVEIDLYSCRIFHSLYSYLDNL